MNVFHSCRNTSDAVPLYLPQNLYLKPIARIHISVQLPHKIEPGKSISNWEIMEKLRTIVKPEEFCILKVIKTALEFIRFEAEIENRSQLYRIIAIIDGQTIKLNAFSHVVKVRAMEAKSDFPNRHTWDSFFRDADNMNELKPGERPDTIHISNLPIKWFIPPQHAHKDNMKPSQKVFQRIFEKFGRIRCVDIPICDPYRNKMKEHITGMRTFTFDQDVLFEGYVQFEDYIGFSQTMDAFRNMKLLRKENDEALTINIKVDFDKTKHLCDATIRRRQIVRERLMARDRDQTKKQAEEVNQIAKEQEEKRQREQAEKEEKEKRRREREEKRKAKHFSKLKIEETEELKKKISKEKKKLSKAQRKLHAIRILELLFTRIQAKKEKEESIVSDIKNSSTDEITKLKILREKQVKEQRENLKRTCQGRVLLKSVLNDGDHKSSSESDSSSSSSKKHRKKGHKNKKKSKSNKEVPAAATVENPFMANPNWFGYMPPNNMYPYAPMYRPPVRGMTPLPPFYQYPSNTRPPNGPGPSRGNFRGRRPWRGRRGGNNMSHYTPELQNEYYKYFRKFLDDDDREKRSYSRSSRSRSSSRDHHRRLSNSRSKRTRSSSRRRNRSRSRTRSKRSRSRHRSYTRSKSRSRSRSKSRSRSRSKSRARSRSRSQTRRHKRSRSRTKNRSPKKSRSPSYQSIDSSKFISPNRLRSKRTRSKSWSLPRQKEKKRSSWSRTPSPSVSKK